MSRSSLEDIPDLFEATYRLVAQVPEGMVTTYGQVATALGDIVASRFVGLAMSMNDDVVRVPCRRVVRSDGDLGGYTGGGPERKAELLRKEGIRVKDGRVQDLDEVLFSDFVTDRPLETLRQRQQALRHRTRMRRSRIDVQHVAGIDVAYDGDRGYAVAAIYDMDSGRLEDHVLHEGNTPFPYVPTYLAFRELPLVLPLAEELPSDTVLMYDGNGLLHPWGMGIATHAGIAMGMPSVGVAKSLLCGKRTEGHGQTPVRIYLDGKVAGYELAATARSKPVYVSAGHGIGGRQSVEVVRRFLRSRVPEPTRTAHILATKARRGTSHK